MYIVKLPNAGASILAVTATATSLFSLIDTAAGSAANLDGRNNAVDINVEDGDIRVLFDGNTPTAANGLLLSSGTTYQFRGVPLTQMQLIRTGGSNVSCSVQVGRSDEGETSNAAAYAVTLEASSVTIGDVTIEGKTAHDDADANNPVKIGGYAADPTSLPTAVVAADRVNAAYSLQGEALAYLTGQIAGENLAANRLMVETQHTTTRCTADTLVLTGSGYVHDLVFSANGAVTAGLLTIYDNTAESGTVIWSGEIQGDIDPITIPIHAPVATGIYAGFDATIANVQMLVAFRAD